MRMTLVEGGLKVGLQAVFGWPEMSEASVGGELRD